WSSDWCCSDLLRAAELLPPPADDRLVGIVEIAGIADRGQLAGREFSALPSRDEYAVRIRIALGVDDVRQKAQRVVGERRAVEQPAARLRGPGLFLLGSRGAGDETRPGAVERLRERDI